MNWIEIVLGDGEVVKASRDHERADLFWGAAGSLGTLGVTTLFELRLIEATPLVELTYHRTSSTSDALETMHRVCEDDKNDFVDGVLFGGDHGVIVTGRLVRERTVGRPFQRFSLPQNPWFYMHAERTTKSQQEPFVFTTPLRDYLFRYDRGAFCRTSVLPTISRAAADCVLQGSANTLFNTSSRPLTASQDSFLSKSALCLLSKIGKQTLT